MARLPVTLSEASTKDSSSLRDFFFFSSGHLNFCTSIYPPFNLAYNDAIRTKSIWKFCWERLMFRGFSAANAAAPALATDALKATDTFSPNIITIMPTSRINVAACSGPSRLRWELFNAVDTEKRRLLRLAEIYFFIFYFFLVLPFCAWTRGVNWLLSPQTEVTGCISSRRWIVSNKQINSSANLIKHTFARAHEKSIALAFLPEIKMDPQSERATSIDYSFMKWKPQRKISCFFSRHLVN